MVYAHVKNKKTGVERKNVTISAYKLLSKSYDLYGYVNEKGDPVDAPSGAAKVVQKKRDVEPAANRPRMSPEEIEAKKAELKAMNDAAIKMALDEQAKEEGFGLPDPLAKERKKPGPKPKQHAV